MVCHLYVSIPASTQLSLTVIRLVAGGTAFTLFLLLVSFLLSSFLLLVPIIYDRLVIPCVVLQSLIVDTQVGPTETACAIPASDAIDFHPARFRDGGDAIVRFHRDDQR